MIFQSTLPVRGATKTSRYVKIGGGISIHAPRAGSDRLGRREESIRCYFNPRSPCGERHYTPVMR